METLDGAGALQSVGGSDDVNDMDESMDAVEPELGSLGRRDFLTKAAAAGAIAWVAPVILSRPAHATGGGGYDDDGDDDDGGHGGTPKCRPTIKVQCIRHKCREDDHDDDHDGWYWDDEDECFYLPGFVVTVGDCPCAFVKKRPITCIKVDGLTSTCGAIKAYGNGTSCESSAGETILATSGSGGTWKCFDPTKPVFFGRARNTHGAIPPLPSNCTITFRLGVWAGNCPDQSSSTAAFNCQTYDVTIVWNKSTMTITECTFTLAAAVNSFCTSGKTPPGGCLPCP
jgi:hypothetical protein